MRLEFHDSGEADTFFHAAAMSLAVHILEDPPILDMLIHLYPHTTADFWRQTAEQVRDSGAPTLN